jgi:hypothetical protein
MSPCFSETLDEIASEHDYESCYSTCEYYSDSTIDYTIPMHRYDICHTRSREGKWKCERHYESLIEIFMDKMISLHFIYFCTICFFSLYHRESYEKKYDSSGNAKIFSLKPEKCKHILSEKESREHRYKEYEPESHPIFAILSLTRTRMKLRVERERRKWLKKRYE